MKTNLVKKENATAVVTVAVEKNEWAEAQAKGFQKAKARLKLDGFRDGKSIPDGLAKSHLKEGDVFSESIDVILPTAYEAVLKEQKLVPFMQPNVNVTKISKDELELTFDIPLYPEVELGEYKGITIEAKPVEVTKDEVKASLNNLTLQHADLVVTAEDHKALKGDTVVFDFKGYVDNKEFEGGSATNYSLELGSNQFVPGFEDQLVGVKAGDSVDVNVTFPEQYVKELAGKKALFKCDIHEIKTKLIPEINDEFVASLGIENVATVDQLHDYAKANILKQKEQNAKQEQFNKLIDKIAENSKIEIGEKVLEKEVEAMLNDIKSRMEQQGLTFEQYLEITNTTVEQLNEQLKVNANKNLRAFLTVNKVGEVEKLSVADEEVENEIAAMAKQYNMEVEKVKEILGDNVSRMRNELLQRKIEKFLLENNNL